jgi:hypothetical protein
MEICVGCGGGKQKQFMAIFWFDDFLCLLSIHNSHSGDNVPESLYFLCANLSEMIFLRSADKLGSFLHEIWIHSCIWREFLKVGTTIQFCAFKFYVRNFSYFTL